MFCMKRITSVVLLCALILALTGCGSDESRIVGRWYVEGNEDFEFYFLSNGTGSVSNSEGGANISWEISDDLLKITQDGSYQVLRFRYQWDGNTLVLTYDENAIYLRKK